MRLVLLRRPIVPLRESIAIVLAFVVIVIAFSLLGEGLIILMDHQHDCETRGRFTVVFFIGARE